MAEFCSARGFHRDKLKTSWPSCLAKVQCSELCATRDIVSAADRWKWPAQREKQATFPGWNQRARGKTL